MERISKLQFMDRMCKGDSLFLGVTRRDVSSEIKIEENKLDISLFRHVVKRQTNALLFSNHSRLCVDQVNQTFWSTCDGTVLCRKVDENDYQHYVWYYVLGGRL